MSEILEDSTAYDLLFIGPSRILHGVNPRVIDSICHVNSYNAGYMGGRFQEFELIFDGYLVHHPNPKTVILDIDLESFKESKFFFRYTQFFPFLDNPVIYNKLLQSDPKIRLIKHIPFLGIADIDDHNKFTALKMLAGKDDDGLYGNPILYKGYLSNSLHLTMDTVSYLGQIRVSDTALASLQNIISKCKKSNIPIMFTYAPEYHFDIERGVTNTKEIFDLINEIARKNAIPFVRYDSLAVFQDKKLFADTQHLNDHGATVFSCLLGDDIKRILLSK